MTHTHARAAGGRTPAASAARPADLPPGSATPPSPSPLGEGGPHTRTALADGAPAGTAPGVGTEPANGDQLGDRVGKPAPELVIPKVIGLDLSAESSGIALPDGTTLTIKAPKPRGKKRVLLDDLDRIDNAEARIAELLLIHRPALVVIEDYAYSAGGSGAHRIGEIGGAVRLACYRAGAGIALVNTTHLKIYATGNSKAEKRHMALEAFKRTRLEFATDDECDGAWLRWLGLDLLGHPEFQLPEKNRAVLSQINPSNGVPRG